MTTKQALFNLIGSRMTEVEELAAFLTTDTQSHIRGTAVELLLKLTASQVQIYS